MRSRVVARRYAEAFFRAIQNSDLDALYVECKAFAGAAGEKTDLGEILRHPTVKYEQKDHLVRLALKKAVNPLLCDFVLLLLKRYRFQFFPLIVEELERLYFQAKSIVPVQVKSAVPLREAEMDALEKELSRLVKGSVVLSPIIDPSIKGGLVISYDNKILDASVNSKLKLLKEKMNALNSELLNALGDAPIELA